MRIFFNFFISNNFNIFIVKKFEYLLKFGNFAINLIEIAFSLMNNLLSLKFWLDMRPGDLTPAVQKYLIIFIAVLAILAFIFTILKSRKRGYMFVFGKNCIFLA